jgi:hypothetical protein
MILGADCPVRKPTPCTIKKENLKMKILKWPGELPVVSAWNYELDSISVA